MSEPEYKPFTLGFKISAELLRELEAPPEAFRMPSRRERIRSWWRNMRWRIKVLFTGDCGCY